MIPLILITGKAGSGKDTVANFIAEERRGCTLAHADPMKRIVHKLWGIPTENLWGPSQKRNEILDTQKWPMHRPGDSGWQADNVMSVLTNNSYVEDKMRKLLGNKIPFNYATEKFWDWVDWAKDKVKNGQPFTARFLLQTLGTEFGRTVHANIWTDYAVDTAIKLLGGEYNFYAPQDGANRFEDLTALDTVIITDGRFRNEVLNVKRVGGICIRVDGETISTDSAGVKNHASETEQNSIPDSWFDYIFRNDKSKGLDFCRDSVKLMTTSLLGSK